MRTPKRQTRVISLGTKTALCILAITMLLAAIAIAISYYSYVNAMDEHFKTNATNVAKTAAAYIDGDRMEGYLRTLETDEAYDDMLQDLFIIKNNNDVRWLYVEKITSDGVTYIMDADDPEEAVPLGTWYPSADEFAEQTSAVVAGNASEPAITNGDFGWLVSIYYPVFDSSGKCVAHVGVDISMEEVMADRYDFLAKMLLGMGAAAVILSVFFVLFMRRSIVRPINQLASAATSFVSEKGTGNNTSPIEKLTIHTGDEIENLLDAIRQMEHDINDYIDHLTSVTAEKERIGAELDVATTIQASMLPCMFPPYPDRKEFEIYASMEPAKEVGGDFYDFFFIDEHRIALVIADVSGKGIPAALFMVIAKTLIKNYAHLYDSPAEVFNATNAQLCETNEAEMFVTAFMGVLDLRDGCFKYANAGHNAPLIRHGDGRYEPLDSNPGFVLAGLEDMRYQMGELQMAPGDCLFLYTDGVTEALNLADELYGDDRLDQVINRLDVRFIENPERLLAVMRQDIAQFSDGAEQADDITMLALQYNQRAIQTAPAPVVPQPASQGEEEAVTQEEGPAEAAVRIETETPPEEQIPDEPQPLAVPPPLVAREVTPVFQPTVVREESILSPRIEICEPLREPGKEKKKRKKKKHKGKKRKYAVA